MKDNVTALLFNSLLMSNHIPVAETEFRFAPPRKWRFDFSWIDYKIALEVEGAVWIQGRHTRGSGFLKDMEKYNAAASLGWLVLRTTPKDLMSVETIELLKRTIAERSAA